MSFQDIFKDSFLETASSVSVINMAMTLLLAFIIGVFIYQVYKKTYQSVVYTRSFSLSLVGMTMITSLVILAVTSNVVLSLGMVGALSIVRFRTAIKDPMDIVFMFWALASGIVTGAGFYLLAIVGSFVIGVVLYVASTHLKNDKPYVLMVNFKDEKVEQEIQKQLKEETEGYRVKSKTVDPSGIALTIEVRVKENEMSFINKLNQLPTVSNAMLVSTNEYSY